MNLLASFLISNLNPRREKAGEDDGLLACDIKLSAELSSTAVAGLFSTDNARGKRGEGRETRIRLDRFRETRVNGYTLVG